MAIVITDDKHYKAIGQAIRQVVDNYEGEQPTYKPEEMTAGVQRVFQIGQRVGAENADSGDSYHQGYIDALENFCPEYTESGAAVRFDPLDDETDSAFNYPIKVVSGIAPSGTPCTEIKLCQSGKNLWCHANRYEPDFCTDMLTFDPPLPVGTYTLSATIESDWPGAFLIALYFPDGSNKIDNLAQHNHARTFTITQPLIGLRLYENGAATTESTTIYTNIQLEAGNTATAFEPYHSNVITAQLGQEVYGGTFNWNTGVLTVTHGADGTALGAPLTVQLTAQEIAALPGVVNTLYSNTGDTTVTYRVNPKEIIIALGSEI